MKHVVAVLSLVVLLVAPGGLARAQTVVKASGSLIDKLPARKVAPAPLPAKTLLARVNRKLKSSAVKAIGSVPQTLEMRVTPSVPKGAAGGAIAFMGPGVWQAPESGAPDGSFLAQGAAVRMEFPTVPNKLYVLDCRMEMMQNASVRVERPGVADAPLPVEDGHLVHAFIAKQASSKVALRFTPPASFPAAGYFYGCDFGKANP
ncbi:MAG TPA: hypothetical protein VMZ28_09680 [Kofleriaceae bacterium]|nr:hypothetical protein [Kofleriaceae bacterium]